MEEVAVKYKCFNFYFGCKSTVDKAMSLCLSCEITNSKFKSLSKIKCCSYCNFVGSVVSIQNDLVCISCFNTFRFMDEDILLEDNEDKPEKIE